MRYRGWTRNSWGELDSSEKYDGSNGDEDIAAGRKASGAAWQYCRNSRRLIPMELRFLERRISESPRVYRAGAKSSIGVWARQVCAAVPAKALHLHSNRPSGSSQAEQQKLNQLTKRSNN